MKQSVLDAVVAKLDEVDQRRDEDWVLLGEKLRDAILDKDEVRAVFTEDLAKWRVQRRRNQQRCKMNIFM